MLPTRPRSRIRRRLLGAFAVLVALVALASGLALHGQRQFHALVEDVARAESGIQIALRLAAAVRDQYAHQAHMIVLGDRSHMHLYDDAKHGVGALLREARQHSAAACAHSGPCPEAAAITEIERLTREMDRNFFDAILPAVGGDPKALVKPHDRALELVSAVVARADELTGAIAAEVRQARARADAGRRLALVETVGFIVAALGFAIGVAIYLDRSITGPLQRLAEGARRLGTGDLETRIPAGRDDELGALAQRFNDMAAELAERQARIVQSEKLAGIGRLAAGVAHEINNPLAAILGYAKLIARAAEGATLDAARLGADARLIADEAGRCREIVAGLLDLARPPRLALGPVDLAELARDVAERLPDAGVSARVQVHAEGDATVSGDAGKLRQILWNLLRNAAEAGGAAPVEVRVGGEDGGVRVAVQDGGPGVSEEARARLFEPFFTTKPNGTGLGLAVSAALARAHGGRVEHVPAGRGARFDLVLPREVAA